MFLFFLLFACFKILNFIKAALLQNFKDLIKINWILFNFLRYLITKLKRKTFYFKFWFIDPHLTFIHSLIQLKLYNHMKPSTGYAVYAKHTKITWTVTLARICSHCVSRVNIQHYILFSLIVFSKEDLTINFFIYFIYIRGWRE